MSPTGGTGARSDAPTALIVRVRDAPPEPTAPWRPTEADAGPTGAAGRARLRQLARLLPMAVVAVLGGIGLNRPGLWEDELATWGMVTVGFDDFVAVLRNVDASIGPYYLLLRGWVALAGSSDVALRVPSLLAMTAAAGGRRDRPGRSAGCRVGRSPGCCSRCCRPLPVRPGGPAVRVRGVRRRSATLR